MWLAGDRANHTQLENTHLAFHLVLGCSSTQYSLEIEDINEYWVHMDLMRSCSLVSGSIHLTGSPKSSGKVTRNAIWAGQICFTKELLPVCFTFRFEFWTWWTPQIVYVQHVEYEELQIMQQKMILTKSINHSDLKKILAHHNNMIWLSKLESGPK